MSHADVNAELNRQIGVRRIVEATVEQLRNAARAGRPLVGEDSVSKVIHVVRRGTEERKLMSFDIQQPVFDPDGEYLEDAAIRYREVLMEHFAASPGGQWVAAGALDQTAVEDALFAAAERNGLVGDPKDGPHKTWATIRSGLSAGLQQPIDLDAEL